MRTFIIVLAITLAPITLQAQSDKVGSSDHPLFTRMGNFYIYEYETKTYETIGFYTNEGTQEIGGKYTYLGYWANDQISANPPSSGAIVKNYIQAAQKLGGTSVLYESSQQAVVKITQNNAEVWVGIEANSGSYRLKIIEKQMLQQEVVADMAWMKSGLNENGKVVLYGILFDSALATLRPESMSVIEEIAKLLREDPTLTVFIVGHTDNIGEHDYNLKLSDDRADAVVNTLINQHQISSSQVIPFGAGQTCPIATNSTAEGRQLNRRVELVKK